MIEEACLRLTQESSLFEGGCLRWGKHCSFSINFHQQKHFSKVEMIKGKYDYFQKGKGLLKCAAIDSSKHFVNVGFNY